MARAVQSNNQVLADSCCVGGMVVQDCSSCGGHPRQRPNCQRCGGAGCTYIPCPTHGAFASTGYSFPSYDNGSNSSAGGYGTGTSNSTYGQNYGSSSSSQ